MGLYREGAYLKSSIFIKVCANFPNCAITPITKTEQESGKTLYHRFNNTTSFIPYLDATSGNKDHNSIESD